MKPRDFIRVLEDPSLPNVSDRGPHAEALRALVVHLFFADTRVADGEISLLRRLLPDIDLHAYIERVGSEPLDLGSLAELFPDATDRDDILTLAEHAVWGDDDVDSREWDLVDQLVETLGIERD